MSLNLDFKVQKEQKVTLSALTVSIYGLICSCTPSSPAVNAIACMS